MIGLLAETESKYLAKIQFLRISIYFFKYKLTTRMAKNLEACNSERSHFLLATAATRNS